MTNTSIGSKTAAPPKPVTAANIAAANATPARSESRSASGMMLSERGFGNQMPM
jgi:hypothetical protein